MNRLPCMTLLAPLALVLSLGPACSDDAPPASGVQLCVSDAECTPGQDCEHINSGESQGFCVTHCQGCNEGETCYSGMSSLGFEDSCMQQCGAFGGGRSCAAGFFCFAAGACFPASWRPAMCAVYPKANGCT
jgi:hypothetical protein